SRASRSEGGWSRVAHRLGHRGAGRALRQTGMSAPLVRKVLARAFPPWDTALSSIHERLYRSTKEGPNMSDNRAEPPEPTWGNPSDEHTVGRERTPRFRSARPRSRWVGVLTPVGGLETQAIRLDRDEMVVGREKGLTAPVADTSVSRQHARITRRGDEFELEDLGSFNGTHINGVPVRSCVLADGDTVQFGQNLYLFERILETGDAAGGGQPTQEDPNM